MAKHKKHWFLNILMVVAVLVSIVAFVVHYKNWVKKDTQSLSIVSGLYYKQLRYKELDSVVFVDKIPPMVRLNGFSAFEKGKGVYREFKDSLNDKKVYVFVDNFEQQKIKLVYKDSMYLYLNFKDSLETVDMHQFLMSKLPQIPN